jgi:hypothetical protein
MTMRSRRLRRLLAAYGADPGRWPAAEVAPAQARLEISPEAQARQREAQALDARLDRAPAPVLDPALLERVVSQAAGTEQEAARRHLPWRLVRARPAWPQLAALGAAAALGLIVGWSALLPMPAEVPPPDVVALTLLDGLE